MEQAIERFVAIAFLATGLSHIAAPRAWAALFIRWRDMGEAGGLLNALLHGTTGFLILAFHPVWRGPEVFVTLIGAALTLKGLLYGVRPGLFARAARDAEQASRFRVAGAVAVAIGLASGWLALR